MNRSSRPDLKLPHRTVAPQQSAKYLGVILDQHLSWAPQCANVIEKGSKWISQIKHIARPSWGITPSYARKLYIGTALPKVLYGVEVWHTPTPEKIRKRGGKLRGSVKVTTKLASVQRAGAIAVTGGLRTSPTDTLNALANLLPSEAIIDKWCYRAALRLAALHDKHPLRKPIKRCTRSRVKKHRSPLHLLLRVLDADTRLVAPKAIATHNPAKLVRPPFEVRIPTSKENSKREAQAASEEIQVFTDGSVIEGKVGAAAVLTRPGKDHRFLHYHLGSENEYTIYDAELAGLAMGLHLIKTERKARRGTMMGADNQAAITAVQNELSTPSHYIAKDILRTAQQIKKLRGHKSYVLMLRWTAGHVGIDGNELIDEEAKKAAKGQSSPPSSLPCLLRQKLKISTAALKQSHNKDVKARWRNKWAKSLRGKRDHQIDSSSPSPLFIKCISNPKLPRQAASLISQLRIAHIPLNSYLHKFKCVDSTRCPACGAAKETVQHFLLSCPGYAHERWALEKAIKCKPNMKTLLGEQESALALKNYVYATHRFDNKPANNGE